MDGQIRKWDNFGGDLKLFHPGGKHFEKYILSKSTTSLIGVDRAKKMLSKTKK
jgi:hypothetical protein